MYLGIVCSFTKVSRKGLAMLHIHRVIISVKFDPISEECIPEYQFPEFLEGITNKGIKKKRNNVDALPVKRFVFDESSVWAGNLLSELARHGFHCFTAVTKFIAVYSNPTEFSPTVSFSFGIGYPNPHLEKAFSALMGGYAFGHTTIFRPEDTISEEENIQSILFRSPVELTAGMKVWARAGFDPSGRGLNVS